MAFEQVKSERARDAAELRQAVASINVLRADLPAQGFGAVVPHPGAQALCQHHAEAHPRRPRRTHLDQLSPHLLRDIGIPPDGR